MPTFPLHIDCLVGLSALLDLICAGDWVVVLP